MLSPSRFQQLWTGTTITARKVYDAVPMQDSWPISKIFGELARTGINLSYPTVSGCLDSLRKDGLIKESKDGFRRAPVRQLAALADVAIPSTIKEVSMPASQNTAAPVSKHDPIEALGEVTQRLAAISAELQSLANAVTEAALDAQAKLEQNEESLKKFEQLRTVLAAIQTAA